MSNTDLKQQVLEILKTGKHEWDDKTIIAYINAVGYIDVEQDNDGQIVLYPGLWIAPDGTLTHTEPDEEDDNE